MEANLSDKVLVIMEVGLRAAIIANHEVAIKKILRFAENKLLILTVNTECLEGLLLNKNYEMMKEIKQGRIQLIRKIQAIETTSSI